MRWINNTAPSISGFLIWIKFGRLPPAIERIVRALRENRVPIPDPDL
ncbi:MAG: hypothetical protein LGR52_12050 [Candidatus Thiosymbion ectosymbiont of Robbea hypermnestra]|nr:hypothetical protein [Candidatus Thiosymbion ectosymbiont of Robbea hypermnestra]